MITVGLAHDLVISAAAAVRDGEVVCAIAEERLNRQKYYRGFPTLALQECLRHAKATIEDVEVIGQGWNPGRHIEFPNSRQTSATRWRPEYLASIPNQIIGTTQHPSGEWMEESMQGMRTRIRFYDHQLVHAANAFYLSGFDHCATFSADGRGERETVYFGQANSTGLKKIGQVYYPASLGLFYGAITQFLGYRPDHDEWKVMAMASYGNPGNEFYQRIRNMVAFDARIGSLWVDQQLMNFAVPEVHGGKYYTPDFVDQLGPPRGRDDDITQRHNDIAWALQCVFEETMSGMLKYLHEQTGETLLAAAGGCMMNSVYNGRITTMTPFEELYVSSCPDDSGIAVGAALLAYHELVDKAVRPLHPHNFWGPSYDEEIDATVKNFKLNAERVENPSHEAAKLLSDGKLVGWYQGRMEFGQRALGNRSILADPRREEMKDIVNAAVKYREAFRPFAPAVLAERVQEYFEAEPNGRSPFMERVYQFKPEVRDRVPAVVHFDGTGRLQSVERETNPRFYELIKRFDELTGVPIVLNTSFNLNGEPIVCTPADAVRTFFSCGLDVLIMGNNLVRKK